MTRSLVLGALLVAGTLAQERPAVEVALIKVSPPMDPAGPLIDFADERSLRVASAPQARPSIFVALQEQLGLRLESRREKIDVLVIESVDMPTPD